jgi:hypothetical protein
MSENGCYNDLVELDWKEKVEKPTFRPDSGTTFIERGTVMIFCKTPEASIYYTTDGSDPYTDNGTLYEKPFVNSTIGETTIKAIGLKDYMFDSDVSECVFKVIEKPVLGGARPVLAPEHMPQRSPRASFSTQGDVESSAVAGADSHTQGASTASTPSPTVTTASKAVSAKSISHPPTHQPAIPVDNAGAVPCAQKRQMIMFRKLSLICNQCLEAGLFFLVSEGSAPRTCSVCGSAVEQEGPDRQRMMATVASQSAKAVALTK